MEAYIFEKEKLVKAKDYSERVFCGYYVACGFNGDNAGDLFVCLSGPILAPAYDKRGKRINVQLKNITIMTQQAINSIGLYRGNNPSTIEMALRMQRSCVVNELMEHFGASSISELAIKLSIG